jgi:hypothetical protein
LSCDQQGDGWQASAGATGDVHGLLLLLLLAAARAARCNAQACSWNSRCVILEVMNIIAPACEQQGRMLSASVL